MKYLKVLVLCVLTNSILAQKEAKLYSIEQFMNTTSILGCSFSPNEDKILYSSDKNGIFNAFTVDVKTLKEQMLTSSKDDYALIISYFPDDERVLFTGDQSGNERNHLFCREVDGSIVDLTPDAGGAIATFISWLRIEDNTYLYYTSNKRDPRINDLYRINVSSAEYQSELVYESELGVSINTISQDGQHIGLTTFISRKEILMHVYSLATKQKKDLHEAKALFAPQFFSSDGSELFYLTDRDHEYMYLEKVNLETSKKSTVEKYDWGISFSMLSDRGKYRVTAINEDGRTVMKLFDHQTSAALKIPDLPEGDVTALIISPSERLMCFYVNGPKSPNDLYLYDFEKKEYAKLTNSLSEEIDQADLVDGEIVRYESYDGMQIPGILYKPNNVDQKKLPAIVYVHGGPGGQSRLTYTSRIQYWVNHGYVVFAVNHRGSSGYGKTFSSLDDHQHGKADLDDLVYARKYLSSLEYVKQDKIAIWGGSYGGYLVLAALTFRPDEFAIGIDYFGVSDLLRALNSIPPYMEVMRRSMIGEMGDPVMDSVSLYSKSPIHFADRIKKPFIVLQGAQDPRVLKRESDTIVAAAQANNVPVYYVVFDDEGHGFLKKKNRIVATEQVLKFMDKYLKDN